MRIGEIGDEEVLVTTDDSGHVVIHFPRDDFSRPPLSLKVPISAWGIDTHSSKRLLAISCNAHIVTVFHLGMGIDGWDWTTRTVEAGVDFPKIVMGTHDHNIPCVSFDQTGDYIASGSLDCSVRIWNCQTGELLKFIATADQYHPPTVVRVMIVGYGLFSLLIRVILNITRGQMKVYHLLNLTDERTQRSQRRTTKPTVGSLGLAAPT